MQELRHFISLGAGVQSSTMALMAAHGEITPMPEAAIFADTGAEPQAIYDWLDWLEGQLPFPVYRVMWQSGLLNNIQESIKGGRFAGAPFFTESYINRGGQLRRQCTREFKLQPIHQKTRELCGLQPRQRAKGILAASWIGISTDEAHRMKPSGKPWLQNRYPLIELEMSRQQCLTWMDRHGYPRPAKSSCTFCPYHNDAHWREMKLTDPQSWQQAIEIDEMIRGGVRGTTQRLYLHRSLKPLAEVDLRNAADMGQIDMFGEDCEGMCGL